MNNTIPTQQDILDARQRLFPHIHRTPVLTCQQLDDLVGNSLFFKCENFQKAGAFKSRGAMNSSLLLSSEQRKNGVATHSSGNHAQALARAAAILGMPAYIVMPENAPKVKIDAVKFYGGRITFCKPTLADREQTLFEVVKLTGATEIHPYNNYQVIAGQATAAAELIEDVPAIDLILAPVGGGGLLSGTALSAHYFLPEAQVIACEPIGADDAFRSFRAGKIIPSENPKTIADGLLTSLGELNFSIIQQYVADIVTVSEDAILLAMRYILERMKIVVEPSSAVPLAALLENKIQVKHKKIGIILSGGNVDLSKLPFH